MIVVDQPAQLPRDPRGLSLAVGLFDGVHLGHQHVVRAALVDAATHAATPAVLTFSPHPLSVVQPERAPRLLQTLPQRLRAFAQLGVQAVLVWKFDSALAALTAEEFIHRLCHEAGRVRSLSVGAGFRFGRDRGGTVENLQSWGAALGFSVHAAPPVSLDGEAVSSSRIRQLLRLGELESVGELLGRPYALAGVVVHGDGLGRQLGIPTANLDVTGLELPPHGVYAAWVRRTDHHESLPAVLNLGVRPTLSRPAGDLRFEVHLLDFDADLYGAELEVTFVRRLRAEQRFPSLPALQAQIAVDTHAARNALGA